MDQPGILSRAALAALAAALVLGVAACGGGDGDSAETGTGATTSSEPQQVPFRDGRDGLVKPSPSNDSANRAPRGASVTYNDPPPPLAAGVVAAAQAAGCTAASFTSEANPQDHIDGESATTQSIPPLSGAHNERWADWGVYDRPVPYKHQIHNLEHGGVIIHYGTEVPVEAVNSLRNLWAASPAFVMVVPDSNPTFPKNAVVAGSWQRWVVCKPYSAAKVAAIEAFVKEYRGRGPEPAAALNAGGDRPDGLPAPEISDTAAEG